MNRERFLQQLIQSGFPEPVEVQQIPNGRLDQHEHPFEVKALVTEGSIVIDGICSVYKPGDIFQLDCGQPHAESYGPQGVKYLASRKQ